jgi:tight adherence protein C
MKNDPTPLENPKVGNVRRVATIDGSRGFQPTAGGIRSQGSRRVATPESDRRGPCDSTDVAFNRRYATDTRDRCITNRGLKPAATVTSSLRDGVACVITALLPLAIMPTAVGLQVLASILVGAAIVVLVWWVFRVLESDDLAQGAEWRYDVSRMNELRRIDPLYRLFQPVLSALARVNRVIFRERLAEIFRQIQAAGLPRFWLPEEYLARMELLAICSTPVWIYLLFWLFGGQGMLLVPVAVIATALLLRYRLATRAAARLRHIKRRMPYLLDLLTLLMEAGATFLNALNQAVEASLSQVTLENGRGHPVAEEFGRVLADMNLGKTRMEAFQAMRDRLADDEITSIIGTIIQGEHLGTPLARIFRSQADVLRVKRSQRAESIAGEAGVNMLMPAVLVMASTVLIILGPFLLNFFKFGMSI